MEGRTRVQMEKQLEDWMMLADNEEVPPFLLLLSRSFDTVSDEVLGVTKVKRNKKKKRI